VRSGRPDEFGSRSLRDEDHVLPESNLAEEPLARLLILRVKAAAEDRRVNVEAGGLQRGLCSYWSSAPQVTG